MIKLATECPIILEDWEFAISTTSIETTSCYPSPGFQLVAGQYMHKPHNQEPEAKKNTLSICVCVYNICVYTYTHLYVCVYIYIYNATIYDLISRKVNP